MLTADAYISVVAQRMQRVRGQLYRAPIGPVEALVGNLYDGAGPIAQMHFCVVAVGLPEVNGFIVRDFLGHATRHAQMATNGVRGLGTAVITLAGLISPVVRPDAVTAATAKPTNSFGGDSRPVVVDLTSGQVHMYTGTKFYGFAIQGAIKAKAQASFPPPAMAARELPPPPPPPPGTWSANS